MYMNKANYNQFKVMYCIVQTRPLLSLCGITFTEEVAEDLAEYVGSVTGTKGKVISFTREELQTLDYK